MQRYGLFWTDSLTGKPCWAMEDRRLRAVGFGEGLKALVVERRRPVLQYSNAPLSNVAELFLAASTVVADFRVKA